MLDQIAEGFLSLAEVLETLETRASDREKLVAILQARIREQEQQITDLKECLKAQPSARQRIFVNALGAAGGTAVVSGAGYLYGLDGQALVQGLWDVIGGFGQETPPTPPAPGSWSSDPI